MIILEFGIIPNNFFRDILRFESHVGDPLEYGSCKDGDMLCQTTVSVGSQLVPVYIQ